MHPYRSQLSHLHTTDNDNDPNFLTFSFKKNQKMSSSRSSTSSHRRRRHHQQHHGSSPRMPHRSSVTRKQLHSAERSANPSTERAIRRSLRHHSEGRGSATRGWRGVAPKRVGERAELPDACFLKPKERKYPVCPKRSSAGGRAVISKPGVEAALVRAAQYGEKGVMHKAREMLDNWPSVGALDKPLPDERRARRRSKKDKKRARKSSSSSATHRRHHRPSSSSSSHRQRHRAAHARH